jgi:hypothetical protein
MRIELRWPLAGRNDGYQEFISALSKVELRFFCKTRQDFRYSFTSSALCRHHEDFVLETNRYRGG